MYARGHKTGPRHPQRPRRPTDARLVAHIVASITTRQRDGRAWAISDYTEKPHIAGMVRAELGKVGDVVRAALAKAGHPANEREEA